jgi:hypothetical protein
MGRVGWVVAALALTVMAGCSSVIPGQAAPSSRASQNGPAGSGLGPIGSDAPGSSGLGGALGGGSGGGLCDTLTPAQLAEVGLAGATGESISGQVEACNWSMPGQFLPAALMLYPNTDLQAIAAAAGGAVQYQQTQVAGRPALEGGTPPGADVCGVMVAVDTGVLSLVRPGSCDEVRRMMEMVIPNLPS